MTFSLNTLPPLLRSNQKRKLIHTQAKKGTNVYFLYFWKENPIDSAAFSGQVFRCFGSSRNPSDKAPARPCLHSGRVPPLLGPVAPPPSYRPRLRSREAPPRPADSRASARRRWALWPAAGRVRAPSRGERQSAEGSAHPTRTDFAARPLRAPLSALHWDRTTSEQGADGARSRRARKRRTGAGIPSGIRLRERSEPLGGLPELRGCRCAHGGHGLALPGACEDGEAAAKAKAARLGTGKEPRGRGARAGRQEHEGPERGAERAATGAAALLGSDTKPSR